MTRLHDAARAYREAHRARETALLEERRLYYEGAPTVYAAAITRTLAAESAREEAERALLAAALEEET